MKFRRDDTNYLEGDDIAPTNANKATIEKYAEKVAKAANFSIGDDPSDVVYQFGGEVHYEDLDDLIVESGSIFVHAEGEFDIIIPQYTSPRRDRFTVGHELGHYFLHSKQGEIPIIAFRQGSTRIEWEANWFAAALLMPAAAFREACSELSSSAEIAERFGVSEDAVEVRRKALNA